MPKTENGDNMRSMNFAYFDQLMIKNKINKLAFNLAESNLDPMQVLSKSALVLNNMFICEHLNNVYESWWKDISGRGINPNYGSQFQHKDYSPKKNPTPPPLPKSATQPITPKEPTVTSIEDTLHKIVVHLIKNGMTEKQLADLFNKAIESTKPVKLRTPTSADFEDVPGFDGSTYHKPEPYKVAPTSPEEYEDAPGFDAAGYDMPVRDYKDKWWYQDMDENTQKWFDNLPDDEKIKYIQEMKDKPNPYKKESLNYFLESWSYLAGIKNNKGNR